MKPIEIDRGGELPHVPGELTEIRDAWIAWEMLSRGIVCGKIDSMEPVEIAEKCGFPDEVSVRQRVFKALASAKVTQSV